MWAASSVNTSSNEDPERMELGMRNFLISATAAAFMAASSTASPAAVRELPYPAVKVAVAEIFKTDPAFETMRKSFVDAVAKRDAPALFGLVGPTFVWIAQGQLAEQLDLGRDALHNFKVVFGFREHGKDTDGPVPDGPFWDSLQAFAADDTHYAAGGALACGPTGAAIVDEKAFEAAKQRIGADDSVEWYFTVADTNATATPAGAFCGTTVVPGGGAKGCDCTEPGGGTPCPGGGRFGVGSRRPRGSSGTSSSSSGCCCCG